MIEDAVKTIDQDAIAETFNAARKQATENAIAALRGPITAFMTSPKMSDADAEQVKNTLTSAISAQIDAYDAAMLAAAKKGVTLHESEVRSAFETFAKEAGWSAAGSYYLLISKYTGDVYAMMNIKHSSHILDLEQMRKKMIHGDTVPVHAEAMARFSNVLNGAALDSSRISEMTSEGLVGSWNGNQDLSDQAMYSLGGGLFMGFIESASSMDSNDPLTHMIGFGHHMIGTSEAMMVAAATIMAVSDSMDNSPEGLVAKGVLKIAKVIPQTALFAKAAGALGSIGKFLSPYVFTGIMAIMVIGIVHAFVLPMLPFIVWLTALVGWLIFVMEAMVAAPIWALTHCRFDGANLIDQAQRQGYVLAFNLFLRPVLMLMGLILSLAAYSALIQYMNNTMIFAIKQTTSGHMFGIVTTLVMLGMITYVQYQLATKTFALIHMVPDRVARWFNAGAENLGEENDSSKAVAIIHEGMHKGESAGQSAMQAAMAPKKKKPNGPQNNNNGDNSDGNDM
ncbi:DotA/TraY family protein [Insolitispirillum peregrinum]|uniref:DotA/TraY family protein n=1 Tax=Insolitispirillum peregrinum TaxID=80876 RepID=UPI00361C9E71